MSRRYFFKNIKKSHCSKTFDWLFNKRYAPNIIKSEQLNEQLNDQINSSWHAVHTHTYIDYTERFLASIYPPILPPGSLWWHSVDFYCPSGERQALSPPHRITHDDSVPRWTNVPYKLPLYVLLALLLKIENTYVLGVYVSTKNYLPHHST